MPPSALLSSAPLFKSQPLHPAFTVDIQLHQPLFRHQAAKKSAEIEILYTLGQMELLLTAEEDVSHLRQDMETLWKRQRRKQPIPMFLALTGDLAAIFPRACQYLGMDTTQLAPGLQFRGGYLNQLRLLNQLVTMATQLRGDLHLLNHKYMAHQLALLFQCVTYAGASVSHFKARIEEKFADIKATTSASEAPQLSLAQKRWMEELTTDIINEVVALASAGALGSSGAAMVGAVAAMRAAST